MCSGCSGQFEEGWEEDDFLAEMDPEAFWICMRERMRAPAQKKSTASDLVDRDEMEIVVTAEEIVERRRFRAKWCGNNAVADG